MRIECNTFWFPKRDNAIEDYEDAAAPNKFIRKTFKIFRCAVADGAAEASFSALWAKLLVTGYCDGLNIPKLQCDWRAQIPQGPLPWYVEEKAQKGAFATLVGLTIRASKEWEAQAIGDSCLVHTRAGVILQSLPLSKAEQFDNSPYLLSSKENHNQDLEQFWTREKGVWKVGDTFFLMTDALARWFFGRQERHKDALACLFELTDQESFNKFIERSNNDVDGQTRMRNDDVTLMKVRIK